MALLELAAIPQGHGSLRPTFSRSLFTIGVRDAGSLAFTGAGASAAGMALAGVPGEASPSRRSRPRACCSSSSGRWTATWTCITYFTKSRAMLVIIIPKHLEALALPLGGRILLAHGPQMDPLPQLVHLPEVLTPLLVDDPQHHLTLDLPEHLLTQLALALLVELDRLVVEDVLERLERVGPLEVASRGLTRPQARDLGGQAVEIPFLLELRPRSRLDTAPSTASLRYSSASSRRSAPSRIWSRRR